MNLNEKLLRYLPKKYHNRFGLIEKEGDLIDDCQYMLYTSNDYVFEDGGTTIPCRSLKEAVHFLKDFTMTIEEFNA